CELHLHFCGCGMVCAFSFVDAVRRSPLGRFGRAGALLAERSLYLKVSGEDSPAGQTVEDPPRGFRQPAFCFPDEEKLFFRRTAPPPKPRAPAEANYKETSR